MKKNIILISIVIIALGGITICEIINASKYRLIKDALKIRNLLDNMEMPSQTEEIIIEDGFTLNNQFYKVKGHGVIFLEEEYSFMISNDNKCALFLSYTDIYGDEIMFQNEECPNYRLVNGVKEVIK